MRNVIFLYFKIEKNKTVVELQTDEQIVAEKNKRGNPIHKQIHEYKTVRTTCKLMRTVPSTTNCNQSLHPDSVMLCWSWQNHSTAKQYVIIRTPDACVLQLSQTRFDLCHFLNLRNALESRVAKTVAASCYIDTHILKSISMKPRGWINNML